MKKGGWYPNAFMKKIVDDKTFVYFRGKLICTYGKGNATKSDLQHVFLKKENIDYYVKQGKAYSYCHNTGETNLIYCDEH